VVIGHPARSSLCAALGASYAAGSSSAGDLVRTVTVSELDFDPLLRGGHGPDRPLEADLQHVQALLRWCDHLVLLYPLWWGGMPALLKGFVDRAFTPGFAFSYADGGAPRRLLAGRSARLIVTMDSLRWYQRLPLAPCQRTVRKTLLEFCGFHPVRTTLLGPVHSSTPADRADWCRRAERLGSID
jgi:putative NADPH-quinone reductase